MSRVVRDLQLPAEIRDRLDGDVVTDLGSGRLGNALLRTQDVVAGPAYLKVARGAAADDLAREADRLRWIGSRLPVPQVLAFVEGDTSFLLMTALEGTPAHQWIDEMGPRELLAAVAAVLHDIHEMPIAGCPFVDCFTRELAEASRKVAEGLIDPVDFDRAYGETPAASLDWLQRNGHLIEDWVFTHGDFTLPNVLIQDGAVSGVVDWGLAGVADRHRDFMTMEVTLRLNIATEDHPLFYQAYAPTAVDAERLRLYSTLDRFF